MWPWCVPRLEHGKSGLLQLQSQLSQLKILNGYIFLNFNAYLIQILQIGAIVEQRHSIRNPQATKKLNCTQ